MSDRTQHWRCLSFFGCKSSDPEHPGKAFNFCPFCGVDISGPLDLLLKVPQVAHRVRVERSP